MAACLKALYPMRCWQPRAWDNGLPQMPCICFRGLNAPSRERPSLAAAIATLDTLALVSLPAAVSP
jgi:hypothetical protein